MYYPYHPFPPSHPYHPRTPSYWLLGKQISGSAGAFVGLCCGFSEFVLIVCHISVHTIHFLFLVLFLLPRKRLDWTRPRGVGLNYVTNTARGSSSRRVELTIFQLGPDVHPPLSCYFSLTPREHRINEICSTGMG